MRPSFPSACLALRDLALADVAGWRDDVRSHIGAGARPLTLFGRMAASNVLLTAVLQTPDGALEVLRATVDPERGYHALTEDHPALHCFERELHEQTGVRVAGHPWLKPVRFEGAPPGAMNAYPFYDIAGKEVHEVQVGPIHAGVIEPGAFRFMCLGETVHHLEIQLGYQHRGIEARLRQGDPRTLAPVVEQIAGDTSVAHAWAYCSAIESLAEVELPEPAIVSRGLGLELERIAMHLAGLAGLAADIGYAQAAATYGRLRTTAINTSMRFSGSRFGRGWLRPGASRPTLDDELAKVVRKNLRLLAKDIAIVNDSFVGALTVQHRLVGVGIVTKEQAQGLGLVGMAARASGVALDQRAFGLGLYGVLPATIRTEATGDCWARVLLRIHEIDTSLAWLSSALERHPTFSSVEIPIAALPPERLAVSVCEGWRGEVVHCLETDALGGLAHYKVQDPSLRNWFGLAFAVRSNDISDFPICNKSFDLSYCGHDL
jgi:Ni,Fe-hydrogenase III large subunit